MHIVTIGQELKKQKKDEHERTENLGGHKATQHHRGKKKKEKKKKKLAEKVERTEICFFSLNINIPIPALSFFCIIISHFS